MSEEELQASTTVGTYSGQLVGSNPGRTVGSNVDQTVGTNTDSYLIIGSSIKK